MTLKEAAFKRCAVMILYDECPPDRQYYLCMGEESDCEGTCTQCWGNFLYGLTLGTIDPEELVTARRITRRIYDRN